MFIYNVTVNVESEVAKDWLNWMQNVHIPDVLATGFFTGHQILELLGGQDEQSGVTYAIQYFTPTLASLETYLQQDAPRLQKAHFEKYQTQAVAFRTVLRKVKNASDS